MLNEKEVKKSFLRVKTDIENIRTAVKVIAISFGMAIIVSALIALI